MKKISIVLAMALLLVVALVGCVTTQANVVKQSTVGENTYSYIDVDPVVIGNTWGEVTRVPLSQYLVEMYFRNPDSDAPIQFATLIVTPGGVGGYSYMLNGNINVCVFNDKTMAYESTWDTFTDEDKAQWQADYRKNFGLDGV